MKQKRQLGLIALLVSFSMVAAACGDDDNGDSTSSDDAPTGGELVIAAEQEPDCMDWIASCAGASWGYWTANVTTLPRPYVVSWDGENAAYEATELLDGEPTLETDGQQVVTYKLNDKVTWNDGTPVSSADFVYTWEQIAQGDDIYDKTGYDAIESVEAPDDTTVVVTFATDFPDWKSLFGGGYGLMPSHILKDADRAALMTDGYDFSAGPWVIEAWTKGESITLVPNDGYWGDDKPKLDKVTFKFVTDTSAEFAAVKSGEVLVAYPQPQLDAIEQINAGLPGVQSSSNARTGNLEALWLNNSKPPFDSEAVRQALGYALDRDEIVKALFGGIGVEEAAQALEPAIVGQYTNLEAFAAYTKDLDKVDELMTGDGWAKNAEGIWEKDGLTASFSIKTTAGNARRELTEQIVQEQAGEAGFEVTIDNQTPADLFGEQAPAGDYQATLYAQVLTTLSPGVCTLFCAKNNPDTSEDGSGQNWQRVNQPDAEPFMETVETSLDESERESAGKEAQDILAAAAVSLPLDPLPNILLWSDPVVGPVEDNPVMGPFFNMQLWGVKS